MQVTLEVVAGPETGRRVHLRSGQIARIGRTQWADFALERDAAMADVHFAVNCSPHGCLLESVAGETATLLDGEAVTQASLRAGSRITAGQTVFLVHIEGVLPGSAQDAPASSASPADDTSSTGATSGAGVTAPLPEDTAEQPAAPEIARHAKLSEPAQALLTAGQPAEAYFAALVAQELLVDAIRFRAYWLPKREAVWWSCLGARSAAEGDPGPQDAAAIEAAEQWVVDPTAENSRVAERHASEIHYATPAGWSAAAAFWSGENIGPAGASVPPPAHLTGSAVAACVTMAAAPGAAPQRNDRYRRMLEIAEQVAKGELPWPKKK